MENNFFVRQLLIGISLICSTQMMFYSKSKIIRFIGLLLYLIIFIIILFFWYYCIYIYIYNIKVKKIFYGSYFSKGMVVLGQSLFFYLNYYIYYIFLFILHKTIKLNKYHLNGNLLIFAIIITLF